jgi:cell division protein ZapA (FtsZ GTPase activity inhibitor)
VAERQVITVDLLGTRLQIRTEQAPGEVQQVAEALRARLDAMQKQAGSVDTLRIALLAALDLTREVREVRAELSSLVDETSERTLALVERLEAETGNEPPYDVDGFELPPKKALSL